jgi:hypothetical protein
VTQCGYFQTITGIIYESLGAIFMNDAFDIQQITDGEMIVWSNKVMPKDRRLTVWTGFLIVLLTPLTFYLSWQLLSDFRLLWQGVPLGWGQVGFAVVVALLCWVALVSSGKKWVQRGWTEQVSVSVAGIGVVYAGIFTPKPIYIPHQQLHRITYEKFTTGRDEQESKHTLNLIHGHKSQRTTLGDWLTPPQRLQLYQHISRIVSKQNWQVEFGSTKPSQPTLSKFPNY